MTAGRYQKTFYEIYDGWIMGTRVITGGRFACRKNSVKGVFDLVKESLVQQGSAWFFYLRKSISLLSCSCWSLCSRLFVVVRLSTTDRTLSRVLRCVPACGGLYTILLKRPISIGQMAEWLWR
jgi:hypothetical protein